jgi:predicted O-linked N-acetylglucosamine transferase (SPINDLY family)
MASKLAARAEATFNQALSLNQQGRNAEARDLCRKVLQVQPKHCNALNLLGLIALQQNDLDAGVDLLRRATMANPQSVVARSNLGNAYYLLKNFEQAIASYDIAIALKPDFADAYYNRGTAMRGLGQNEAAIEYFDRAIALNPSYVQAYNNRGNALRDLGRLAEAITSYEKALVINPVLAEGYNNRGTAQRDLKQFEAAVASYDRAIELKPDYAEAYNNRGNALRDLMRYEAAGASYDTAIELRPDYADAYNGRATLLFELKHYEAAISNYEQVIALKCSAPGLHGQCLQVKMFICDWSGATAALADIEERIKRGEPASNPFCLLARTDSAALQKTAAEVWIHSQFPASHELPPLAALPRREKISVGYFSADFYNHATLQLMAQLFELHDQAQFEITALSFGPDIKDEMRTRLAAANIRVINVRNMPDLEVAVLARSLQLDIAVDLKGFTHDCRPGIFAMRAAPAQVSYLGYPGTMGAEYIDYLIADRTLVPESGQRHYSEKIVYLPNSYQVNDSTRGIAERNFTRAELDLPATGFIYCCFNNTYKITPEVFSSWMRILSQVEGSVLWLLEDNPVAPVKLRREAEQRGISPERIVFAKRMGTSEHLARQRLADLFIDTLPYNAHTTASDALWAGLPLLTCSGESFAGRVAASLLNAAQLPELITASPAHYESMAIELARNPDQLAAFRRRLVENRLSCPLFDTRLFTRHIETAYKKIAERSQAGLGPEHIYIEP